VQPRHRKSFIVRRASLAFAALFCAGVSAARAVPITNPGFEGNVLANPAAGQPDNFINAVGQGATLVAVPGWTFTAAQTDSFTSYGGVSDLGDFNHALDGPLDNNIAWLFINEGKQTGSVSVTQTLAQTLQNNTRYTLTARVAQSTNAEGKEPLDNPAFPTLGNGVNTGDVFARLYAGSPTTAMPGFLPALSVVSVPADDTWVTWTLTWETGANEALTGTPVGIELFNRANTSALAVPVEVFFDDIALTAAPTPEPGALALLALAALPLAGRRRR
jgi:hypothetical protein